MNKKTIFASVGTLLLASVLTTGIVVSSSNKKTIEKASAEEETIVKYLPVNSDNFVVNSAWDDAFDGKNVNDLTSSRFETFHDGRRTYNALDSFLNSMAKVDEVRRGCFRSVRWVHRGGYVSFLLGGNGENFVNIWDETSPHNVAEGIHNDFYASRNSWDSAYQDGSAADFELSGNMALKYFHVPDELIGHELIVYIEDKTQSYYGGVTFGNLKVNQTLEEVARTFSAHKQQIALDAQLSNQNNFSASYMLNTYYKTSYYNDLIAAEANLDNADEGFETYGLSNWAYDKAFSSAVINFVSSISDNDAKGGFGERMPANKSDNLYFNADTTGIDEGEKYRLISNEFSGTGLISAKIGGGTAVMSLIDDTGAELATTRCATAEGTNILNPSFYDPAGGVANIMTSGARLNTMTRTYLDASAHLGEKVRIVLSDERTGGNWGLAYFDEVITKYDTVPTFKVDKIRQQYNENPMYHGVVTDKYVGSSSTTFGQAYAFLQDFYGIMRNPTNGGTYCSINSSQAVQDLLNNYQALNSDVKALVDAAQDFDFGASATSANWYLAEANTGHTVAQTMAYALNLPYSAPEPTRFFSSHNNTMLSIEIVIISSVIVVGVAIFCFLRLKKKGKKQ